MTGLCSHCGHHGPHEFWPRDSEPTDIRCVTCGWLQEGERIVEAERPRAADEICHLPLWRETRK